MAYDSFGCMLALIEYNLHPKKLKSAIDGGLKCSGMILFTDTNT
jgi:hypothetical protein